MDGLLAEVRLIDSAFQVAQYDIEPYPVRSEAFPSLKQLGLVLAPLGVTIYQGTSRLEVFKWTEIWNAGYDAKVFWLRIFRDGENSRQKYVLPNSRLCKVVWKSFKHHFKFYIRDHSIPPKVAWGRVAPTVNRGNLIEEKLQQGQVRSYINHASSTQMGEQKFVPTTEL